MGKGVSSAGGRTVLKGEADEDHGPERHGGSTPPTGLQDDNRNAPGLLGRSEPDGRWTYTERS
jgi:hypothetical protein